MNMKTKRVSLKGTKNFFSRLLTYQKENTSALITVSCSTHHRDIALWELELPLDQEINRDPIFTQLTLEVSKGSYISKKARVRYTSKSISKVAIQSL